MAIIEEIKAAAKVANQIGSVELYKQILDVQGEALQMQEKQDILQRENFDLRDKIRELEQQLKQKEDYVLDRSVWWLKSDIERIQPFCPSCYSNDKAVPMHTESGWDCHYCPACKHAANLKSGHKVNALPREHRFSDDGSY